MTGRTKTYRRLIEITSNPLLYKPSKTVTRPIFEPFEHSYELMAYGLRDTEAKRCQNHYTIPYRKKTL
jgi:hypothetical protein